MRSSFSIGFGVVAAFLSKASAQQSTAWGQCGGIGYTGPTQCPSGWHCEHWNDWYYQCIEGAASSTSGPSSSSTSVPPPSTFSTSTKTSSSPLVTSSSSISSGTAAPTRSCTAEFEPISASDYVAAINPGWNLGNTLDAIPDEGSWNNAPVVGSTFDDVKAAGFKSIRLPVTYADHFVSESPDWTVDPDWLQRVSDVVDMALERDLYVLTNVHHDSWEWADITTGDVDMIEEKFYRLWVQIGETLGCKGSMVAFETINEPPAETEEDAQEINKLNEIFLQALADSGGYNVQRVVTLVGPGMDPTKTSQWFEPPAEIANPWALQFHYYSPYDFVFGAWGKTIWGSDADKEALRTDLSIVRGNFTDVPLVIGEFDASPINTEPAARWKYFDYFTRVATEIGAAIMVWDNGVDNFDRTAHTWRDPTMVEIMKSAIAGEPNSLPDSTEDGGATSQWTSAYVFKKVGEAVADQALPWLFNGNTLVSITSADGTVLDEGSDYSASSDAITFSAESLSRYFDDTAGVKESLVLAFSAGASVVVEVVEWDTPVLETTSSTAAAGQAISIPIEWNGVEMVATVKILENDGTFLVDDWTQWLGPLQQARGTFNNHYNFEGDSITITSGAVDAVIASGQATTFEFEFFPRVEGNSVVYTVNV